MASLSSHRTVLPCIPLVGFGMNEPAEKKNNNSIGGRIKKKESCSAVAMPASSSSGKGPFLVATWLFFLLSFLLSF